MSFLDQIFARLQGINTPVLTELRDPVPVPVTGPELLARISCARGFLASRNLERLARVALLAPTSVDWIAMNLAIIAESLVVVPLYSRQAPSELVTMMKDCSPSLICCGDAALRDSILQVWSQA